MPGLKNKDGWMLSCDAATLCYDRGGVRGRSPSPNIAEMEVVKQGEYMLTRQAPYLDDTGVGPIYGLSSECGSLRSIDVPQTYLCIIRARQQMTISKGAPSQPVTLTRQHVTICLVSLYCLEEFPDRNGSQFQGMQSVLPLPHDIAHLR
jgi:hypothetical protein